MNERPELRLHEEVLLLALKDERGTPHAAPYAFALGGALLAELFLSDRLALEEKPRRKAPKPGRTPDYLVVVKDPKPLADSILDECLHRVKDSKKTRSPQDWVTRFHQLKDLKRRIAVGLCRRGVLREREDRILMLFRRRAYPTLDGAPERRVVERIRAAVEGESADVDPRTAVLIALASNTGLLKPVLGKEMMKRRKDRIAAISDGEAVGAATKAAVEATQAAVIAATAAASVAVSAATAGG